MILLVLPVIGAAYFVTVFLLLDVHTVTSAAFPATTTCINEGAGFPDDFLKDVVTVIGAIGSAATAAALYFIWKQTRMTQQEINATLRPWLGISDVSLINKGVSNEALFVGLKNYGKIPAEVKSVKVLTSRIEITRDQIDKDSEYVDLTEIRMFPEQPPRPLEIKTHGNTLTFIGFSIEYYYSENRKGYYAIIQKHDQSRNIYRPINEWFK